MDAIHDRSDRFALANRSFLIDSLLHMLLLALEKNELGSQMGSSEIVQAIEYIHLHLAEPISVDTLATCCNLSKYHFIRLFDRKTGFTPYHYIQIMRIDKAKKYLVSTDKNISEIAFSVGFGSEANFGKVFRSMTGSTPSAYRKEQFNWSSPQNMGKNENA
jgi:AraC-like DNA-binding protein